MTSHEWSHWSSNKTFFLHKTIEFAVIKCCLLPIVIIISKYNFNISDDRICMNTMSKFEENRPGSSWLIEARWWLKKCCKRIIITRNGQNICQQIWRNTTNHLNIQVIWHHNWWCHKIRYRSKPPYPKFELIRMTRTVNRQQLTNKRNTTLLYSL